MRLFMIRHGESTDDIEDCYGGIADFPLTERGRDQAREVGAQLKGKRIDIIYSSPLRRAEETAMIIVKQLSADTKVKIVENLHERNSYGVLSGVNKDLAKEIFGRILSGLKDKPGYSREPLTGAEDFDSFVQRVTSCFASVVTDATEREFHNIAIVTHGKFTQALFEFVLKLTDPVDLKLSAVNVIDYEPPRAQFVKM